MTYSAYEPGPPGPHERWRFNLPLVIGIIFVFLVGVVVWVLTSGSGDSDGDSPGALATTTTAAPGATDTTTTTSLAPPPMTTTPPPMPSIVSTSAPTTAATETSVTSPVISQVPATTSPGAVADAVPGDLAIEGYPMQQPLCVDSYITVLASAVGSQASAAGIQNVLEEYPNSNYLRTDQACPSLTQYVDGEPIYVVYLGPFALQTDACQARSAGPEGAYARLLSATEPPDHFVTCS